MCPSRHPTIRELPDVLAITPRGPIDATVRAPGSKSLTNRALLIAALAGGESQLRGGLKSDDTRVMQDCLGALGAQIDTRGDPWRVSGTGGQFRRATAEPLYVENSGTTARFLTAAAALSFDPVRIDGNDRMRERPIEDLVDALRLLGAEIRIDGAGGCPPVQIMGGGLRGGDARIDARRSSQYVSAVLLAAPYARADTTLRFAEGTVVSRPYIDLTLEIMREFGAEARWLGGVSDEAGASTDDAPRLQSSEPGLYVRAGQHYAPRDYSIETDASSAAYPFCAAAIAGGRVCVEGVPYPSLQPDFAILGLLERMGCRVTRSGDSATVEGPTKRLRSLGEVDMNAFPDAVLAFAVVALFADGPTLIKNVANLRIKETDRLAALECELKKLGARVRADQDSLWIAPGPLRGAAIDTYDDHRMAMAFSLAGLRIPGVEIRDPACVSKTWPDYFDAFDDLV